MATTATSLSIVKELRRLASVHTNRQYMLRNDVNSLLIFTDPDEQPSVVIIEALHALRYLAQEAVRNERQLHHFQNTVGLQSLLNKIAGKENFNDDCKKLASEILFLSKCNVRPVSVENNSGVITRAGMRNARKAGKEPVKFLGGNKKAKVIMLQIEGLDGEDKKQECTNELLRVTGVISITFNMASQRCTIRARSDMHAESLVHAIHNTRKMTAKQVMKNESGEEVLVSFDDADRSDELPPYLEEDLGDSPNKEENKQSVARPGYTEAVGSFAKSWFGSVVSAVNKNLYW
ncbi:armadillo repeat-containing protein 1-like [Styela clava]